MTKDELFAIKADIPPADVYGSAKDRFDSLAKPVDGFGSFEDIICRIAAVQGKIIPDISEKALVIMCADNGVVRENVSQTGSYVTAAVASLMAKGKSTVGLMTADYPVDVIPVDVGIDNESVIEGTVNKKIARGTGNIVRERAMTDEECLSAICAGIDIVRNCEKDRKGLIATGEMGIGNTTTSAALLCALTGCKVSDVTGRGAGLSDEGLERKKKVIAKALRYHGYNNTRSITPTKNYAFNALATLGGLDIAGLAGVFIGCALCHITVVIDGFISAVAALAASYICPGSERYMIASHSGREKGTSKVLGILGLKPVINADMALGEGTGAVMMFPVLDMLMSVYTNGTSFDDAGVSRYERFGS